MATEATAAPGSLEARLGHVFKKKPLLERALTHSSWANQQGGEDYETLEFLGDAVLGAIVSAWLLKKFPTAREGELTRMRSALVNRGALAKAAELVSLGAELRLGRGEERGGGRQSAAILADVVEALIAALYLDGGMRAAQRFVEASLIQPVASSLSPEKSDAKSRLQEWLQARHLAPARYDVVDEQGPDHARRFTLRVSVQGATAEATASSKAAAQQLCAAEVLARLEGGPQ